MKRSGKMTAGLARAAAITLIAVAACFAFLIILQKLLVPFHIVAGDSMAPVIRSGDAVVITDLEGGDINRGDVIVFHDPAVGDDFIISRVVDIEEGSSVRYFTTMGDNGDLPGPGRIPTGRVVGGIGIRVPGLGGFLNLLVSIKGYVVFIAMPAALGFARLLMLSISESRSCAGSGQPAQSWPVAAGP